MTDYTKTTNFTAKDGLPAGNPAKKILGSLFDTEFNNIATAISTKLESGDTTSFGTGTTIGTLTFADGSITDSGGAISFGNENLTTTGTLAAGATSITGNIIVSGTVDGRDVATDGTKLDGIEPNATADQTDAEIKTAYENNADTNAFTDSEKTKLGTVESGADVTDATNVDAAGAVMNTDTSTAAMGFVIDEDDMASNSDTKVPTQQSVEARIQNRITAIGALMVTGTPVLNDYARFTSATEIEGRSYAEVRVDLGLEIGTDVQAELSGLAVTNVTASTSDKVLIQDVSDSNNLKTVLVSDILGNVITDPTLGTLTKTFSINEQATITLSSAPTGQPVVSVSKEVPQTGTTNDYWDVNSTDENYTRTDYASATTLDFSYSPTLIQAAATGNSLDVSANVAAGSACTFNNDGTKFFIIDNTNDDISEYSLAVAYDLSTATYIDAFSVGPQDASPTGMHFKPDGTKVYVTGNTNDSVYQYDLSTAWDISSAAYASKSVSVTTEEATPQDVTFSNDGTVMMIVGTTADTIFQYTLSTAWDVSTATYATKSLLVSAKETSPRGLQLSSDGKKIWVVGNSSDAVHEYTLSTANDISTGSFTHTLALPTAWAPYGVNVDENVNRLYAVDVNGSNDVVYEYNLRNVYSGTLTLGTGSFAATEVGMSIYANGGRFVLAATDGSANVAEAPSRYTDQVASGDWEMYSTIFNSTTGQLEISNVIQSSILEGSNLISSLNVSTETTTPRGVCMSPDGLHLYVLDVGGDAIEYYTLSTPYDVSTATYDTGLSVATQETSPTSIELKPDGTTIYAVGSVNDTVYAYNMTTAYDLGTASYATQNKSVATEETNPRGLRFKPDGTMMFVVGNADKVFAYDMSTPWDIDNATHSNVEFDVSTEITNPEYVWFSEDGTSMYVGGTSSTSYEYELSTAWDVSTASYTGVSGQIGGGSNNAYDVAVVGNGDRIVVANDSLNTVRFIGLGNFVVHSEFSAAVTSASIDTTYWTDINTMTATDDEGSGVVYYAVSTDDRTTWSVIDETDGVRDIVRNNAGTWEYNSNATYSLETWTAGTTNTELATLEEAIGASYTLGFDVSTASYLQSYDFSAQETLGQGFAFNSDGTKMFITGYGGDDVNEYALSTAFDVTTATFTRLRSVSAQDTTPRDVTFNNDGTKMFIVGETTDAIYEYSLSTGFDLSSTFSYTQSFSVSTQETQPSGIAFNADGTKMFIVGYNGDDVNEYTLTTGFDLSTASYSQNFSIAGQETLPYGLEFNNDGTKMFIIGESSDSVNEYTLSTGFDISTASFVDAFSVASQATALGGVRFNNDGTKMYVLGRANAAIYEYDMGTAVYINQMDKTQLGAVTDVNHFTLVNDLDLAIIMDYTGGGFAPVSDGVSINYDANTLQKGAINGTDYEWDYPASNKVRITALARANLKVRVV